MVFEKSLNFTQSCLYEPCDSSCVKHHSILVVLLPPFSDILRYFNYFRYSNSIVMNNFKVCGPYSFIIRSRSRSYILKSSLLKVHRINMRNIKVLSIYQSTNQTLFSQLHDASKRLCFLCSFSLLNAQGPMLDQLRL